MSNLYPPAFAHGSLPAEFSSLQPYVDAGWAEPEQRDRIKKRLNSGFEDMQDFFDALEPQLNAILDYLDKRPLSGFSEEQARLMQLVLSVAEVRNAVENFGQPEVVDGWDTRKYFIDPPFISGRG